MTITCDEFVASVKRLVTVPATQSLLADFDILALATDIMRGQMVSMIDSTNQGFFLTKSAPIPIVAGQSSYRIPARAIGRKLREVKLIDNQGGVQNMPLINLDRAQLFSMGSFPYGFYFMGDRLELTATPATDTGYSLVFYYAASPGKLVQRSDASSVVAISGDDVTVDNIPLFYATGQRMDFIGGELGNGYLGIGAKLTAITGSTFTFETGTVPSDLEIGDFVCLTGWSPVLQIPEELAPLLQAQTAQDVLQTISDFEGQDRLKDKIKQQMSDALKLIEPRLNGEPTIIVNDRGLLRGRRGGRNYSALWRG